MITLDLRQRNITLEELLGLASTESVLILNRDGQEFLLESADEFEQEVVKFGQSEKFTKFLTERSKEEGVIELEDLKTRLDKQDN
jgi:hypothetical protein